MATGEIARNAILTNFVYDAWLHELLQFHDLVRILKCNALENGQITHKTLSDAADNITSSYHEL